MEVKVNGQKTGVPAGTTVECLLEQTGTETKGTAVAIGGKIVRRSDWESTVLHEGDEILLVKAAYGG